MNESGLVHDSVKYYYSRMGPVLSYKNGLLLHLFMPIFVKDELIYLHGPSIIKYCHANKPDKFKELTQTLFCQTFIDYRVISHGGISYQFRILRPVEFDRIRY